MAKIRPPQFEPVPPELSKIPSNQDGWSRWARILVRYLEQLTRITKEAFERFTRELQTELDALGADVEARVKDAYTFTLNGSISEGESITLPLPIVADATVFEVYAYLRDPPGGQAAIFDVRENTASLFAAANRPTIEPGRNTGSSSTFSNDSLAKDRLLHLDVIQAGLSPRGAGLVVQVRAG